MLNIRSYSFRQAVLPLASVMLCLVIWDANAHRGDEPRERASFKGSASSASLAVHLKRRESHKTHRYISEFLIESSSEAPPKQKLMA